MNFTDTVRALDRAFGAVKLGVRVRVRGDRTFVPPQGGVWVDYNALFGATQVLDLGDGPSAQRRGVLMINIYDRLGAGTRDIFAVADKLLALEYTTHDRLHLTNVSVQDFGDDGHEHYQCQVTIPFYTT